MDTQKRQISKGALINLLGIGIGVILNIWLLPKLFSTGELGVYRWIERTTILLANILLFGNHRAYTKFHADESVGDHFKQAIFSKNTALILGSGALMALCGPLLAPVFHLETYTWLLPVLGFTVAGNMALLSATSVSATTKRIAVPLFLKNIGLRSVMLVGGLIVLWSSFGFIHWMLFFGLGTLALGLGGLYYAWKRVGVQFHLKHTFTAFPAVVRTFMRYSVMTTVVTFGLSTIDIQMLSLLTDYSSVGIYGIAFFMGSVIDGIKRPINQMLAPQFAKAWNTNNTTMLSKLYKKTATIQVLVNVLMVIMILSNIDWIFSLIPNSERFNAAIPVVGWVLLARFIDSSFGSNGEIIGNSPYFRFNFYFSTILITLVIALNLYFIPTYGIVGVAYSGVISMFLFNAMKAVLIYRKSGMLPFSATYVKIIVVGALVFGATMYLPVTGFLGAVIRGVFVLAVLAVNRKFIIATVQN